jgi:hypothetical protein
MASRMPHRLTSLHERKSRIKLILAKLSFAYIPSFVGIERHLAPHADLGQRRSGRGGTGMLSAIEKWQAKVDLLVQDALRLTAIQGVEERERRGVGRGRSVFEACAPPRLCTKVNVGQMLMI